MCITLNLRSLIHLDSPDDEIKQYLWAIFKAVFPCFEFRNFSTWTYCILVSISSTISDIFTVRSSHAASTCQCWRNFCQKLPTNCFECSEIPKDYSAIRNNRTRLAWPFWTRTTKEEQFEHNMCLLELSLYWDIRVLGGTLCVTDPQTRSLRQIANKNEV